MKRMQAVVLLMLMLALSFVKAQQGVFAEMCWISFLSALLLAVGLWFNNLTCTATGFLFQLAIALPAYMGYLLQGGASHWLSFLVHVLAPVFGWLTCRQHKIPQQILFWAYAFYCAALIISRYTTPQHLNINFAFEPYNPFGVADYWTARLINTTIVFGSLLMAWWLFNRIAVKRDRAPRS